MSSRGSLDRSGCRYGEMGDEKGDLGRRGGGGGGEGMRMICVMNTLVCEWNGGSGGWAMIRRRGSVRGEERRTAGWM